MGTGEFTRLAQPKEVVAVSVALVARVTARLRATGITVHEVDGWRTRARPGVWRPRGLLVHHTAIRASYTRPAAGLRTCVEGRADLPGPLCQTLGGYDGAVHVISAGRANHGGKARAAGPVPAGDANSLYWGHEIDYYPDAPMSAEQYRTATILGAILVSELGVTPEHVRAHAETSVTGKWDPGYAINPNRTIDMAAFRRAVGAALTGTPSGDTVDLPDTLPDLYAPGLPAKPTADLLAWGVAHAAHARDRATEARDETRALRREMAELRAAVDRLAGTLGPIASGPILAEAAVDVAVIAEAVADELARRAVE